MRRSEIEAGEGSSAEREVQWGRKKEKERERKTGIATGQRGRIDPKHEATKGARKIGNEG